MTSLEEVVDPRVAVLIVWAIFFFTFIVLPSLCLRCLGCCGSGVMEDGLDNINREGGVIGAEDYGEIGSFAAGWESAQAGVFNRYMFLSAHKKRLIDEMRMDAIQKYLKQFSLVLERKHMVRLDDEGKDDEGVLSNDNGKDTGGNNNKKCTRGDCDEECPPFFRDMASPDDYSTMASPDDYMDVQDLSGEEGGSTLHSGEEQASDKNNEAVKEDTDCIKQKNGVIEIIAPRGRLGIHLTGDANEVEVTSITRNSPLRGKIKVGDRILSVDGEDTRYWADATITVILMNRAQNPQRKITVFRAIEEEDEKEREEGNSEEYTHVRIPNSGYDRDGMQVREKKKTSQQQQSLVDGTGMGTRRFQFFPIKVQTVKAPTADSDSNDDDQEEENDAKNDNDKTTHNGSENKHGQSDTTRTVPHFCAVCLGEYQPPDTISWSSNAECTHVFHTDCIAKWLNTLGKKHSKYNSFPAGDPSNINLLELLDYKLECPCCRQEFISRLVLESGQECGNEENGAEIVTGGRDGGDENV